jgi:hypothetical protein
MSSRVGLLGGLVLFAAVLWWAFDGGSLEASDVKRRLSDYSLDREPFGVPLPPLWKKELQQAIALAPEVSLLDQAAPAMAAEVLRSVSWVDPQSVAVQLKLPEGLQVEFLPRAARYLLLVNSRPVGVLAADGTMLPRGLPADFLGKLIHVQLEPGELIPPAGKRISSPVALEALRAWQEIQQVQEISHLKIKRIQRKTSYTNAVRSVTPPLTLVLRDGRELEWGRSDASRDPNTPDLALKMARLGAAMRQYPGLNGVQVVSLDHPDQAFLLDAAYQELPFDSRVLLTK